MIVIIACSFVQQLYIFKIDIVVMLFYIDLSTQLYKFKTLILNLF